MQKLVIGAAVIFAAASFGLFKAPGGDVPRAIPEAAPGKSPLDPRPVKENVIAYHTSDAGLNAARAKARSTLPRFLELVSAGTPGTYTVKFPLTQNGATEHIWMQLTGYNDRGFTGLLANDPVNGRKYKRGDPMEVASADVEDWMINNGKVIHGGYTVRAMLKDMPKEQADKLRTMFRD
jgi:uncharacterized protein YegJ (DUF2314 family)